MKNCNTAAIRRANMNSKMSEAQKLAKIEWLKAWKVVLNKF